MKNKIFIIIGLMFCAGMIPLIAQNSVLGSGGNADSASGSISYSIGQVFYINQDDGNNFLSTGVQQPAEISGVLPVELLYFKAIPKENEVVELTWETAVEYNNNFFSVERSKDGQLWELVKKVDGVGFSNKKTAYRTMDENPYNGSSFYRLKQTDYDGQFSFSDIKQIELHSVGITIYPNPVSDELFVNIPTTNQMYFYTLYDTKGKELMTGRISNEQNRIIINKLSPNTYFLNISLNNEIISTLKIFKK